MGCEVVDGKMLLGVKPTSMLKELAVMETRKKLEVIDSNGVKLNCEYTVSKRTENDGSDVFRAYATDNKNVFQEIRVEKHDENSFIIVEMATHFPQDYHGRYIGAALIQEISRYFGKRVCSSRRFLEREKGANGDDRESNWRHLIDIGKAIYNKDDDHYWLI